MSEFDERKLEYHPVCCYCKHYVGDDDDDCGGYCLLGRSSEDKKYVWNVMWDGGPWDEKMFSILEMPENGDLYDSKRAVEAYCSCQFFESLENKKE